VRLEHHDPEPAMKARLGEIGRHLGIPPQEALQVWKEIENALPKIRELDDVRGVVGRTEDAKQELIAIARASRRLAKLLTAEPLRRVLILGEEGPGHFGSFREIKGELVCVNDTKEVGTLDLDLESAPAKFIDRLKVLAARAQALAGDDERFRAAHGLLSAASSNTHPAILVLWPVLFRLWSDAGKKLAETPGGPLYRFVVFAHREMRLEPPKQSTFRAAVRRFMSKRDDNNLSR